MGNDMAIDAYDPDTGFTCDVVEIMSGSMLWCFSTIKTGKFRFNPADSLAEAPNDAWILEWKRENGNDAGEVMCAPMLVTYVDEIVYFMYMQGTEDELGLRDMALREPVAAAKQATQWIRDRTLTGGYMVPRLLGSLCEQARGSLR